MNYLELCKNQFRKLDCLSLIFVQLEFYRETSSIYGEKTQYLNGGTKVDNFSKIKKAYPHFQEILAMD